MTLLETISLIKNYEEQVKNYLLYMNKINYILMNNPNYVSEIKMHMSFDNRLKNRLITLGNTSNGSVIKHVFPEIFIESKKKTR